MDGVDAAALTEKLLVELVATTHALTSLSADALEELVARVIVDTVQTVGADRAALWLQHDDRIEVVATTGMRATTVDRFLHVDVAPDTPGEKLLMRRSPVTWSTHDEAKRYFPVVAVNNLGSGYVSPLHADGRFFGVFFVGWAREHRSLGIAERAFLDGIANCCALALEHGRSGTEADPAIDLGEEIVELSDTLSVKLTKSKGASTAWIAGEIDYANEAVLERALAAALLARPRGALAFDLSEVAFLSVGGGRIVLAASRRSTEISIVNASSAARRVIDLLAHDFED